mgnify:CR=1 FL=1
MALKSLTPGQAHAAAKLANLRSERRGSLVVPTAWMCCEPLDRLMCETARPPIGRQMAIGVRLIFQPDEGQAVGIELVARIAGARDRFTPAGFRRAWAVRGVRSASAAGVISATAGWAIGRSDADDRRKVTAHRLDRGLNRCDGKGDHSHAAVSARDFAMKA